MGTAMVVAVIVMVEVLMHVIVTQQVLIMATYIPIQYQYEVLAVVSMKRRISMLEQHLSMYWVMWFRVLVF